MQKRWLFIEPGRIGDWVMANAVVRLFLEEHGGTIDWAVRSEIKTLLKCGVPYEKVIYIPGRMSALKAMGLIWQCMRNPTKYDGCCVLTPGKSGLLVNHFVRAVDKFGYIAWEYGRGLSIGGTPIVYKPDTDHLLYRALQTCVSVTKPADYKELVQDEANRPSLKVLPKALQAVDDVLASWGLNRSFIAMNPGSRSTFRRWPVAHWRQLITLLLDQDVPVVIAGSPAEYDDALDIQQTINRDGLFVMEPCPLDQYAALLSKSRMLVCHDSGPMHLAPALGTPVVAIYGPSDPALTAPICDASILKIVRCEPTLPCQPCITPMNSHLEFDHCTDAQKCMRALSPQTVFDAVNTLYAALS